MLTLSKIKDLRYCSLWLILSIGCLDLSSTPSLPKSSLEMESWLQTSRKVRYPFDVNTQWEGWILHSPKPTQVGIAHFELDTLPTIEQWQNCIRSQPQASTLWISATLNTLNIAKQYALQLHDNLPIVQVKC